MPKVIAIDGPAGAGKSTVARALAADLGYTYLDSGALYRAVTWYLLTHEGDRAGVFSGKASDADLERLLASLDLQMRDGRIFVGPTDVTEKIRDMQVSNLVSVVSERRPVREKLMVIQRAFSNGNVVVEGRDMGTVVFPFAFLKVYLDADAGIRAGRRFQELGGSGASTDYDEVYENLKMRDERDSHRQIAPLARAPDAVYVDTTYLTTEEAVGLIRKLVEIRSRRMYALWQKIFYRSMWIFLKALTAAYLFRRVRGAEHVESMSRSGRPVIFASNHVSHLDPILVAVSMNLSRPLHFLAKKELADIPVFGEVIRWMYIIPVRRGILDHEAIYCLRAALAANEPVLIFPEGTRSRDGEIHDAKAGFGKLVYESGVPVIPVRVTGSFDSFPPGALWPRPRPVRVTFGEPMDFRNDPSLPNPSAVREIYETIGRRVMARIREMP